MKKYILLTLLIFILGMSFTVSSMGSVETPQAEILLALAGNLFLFAPYPWWIYLSNRIVSKARGIEPPSRINYLALYTLVAFWAGFGGAGGFLLNSNIQESHPIAEGIFMLSLISGFGALIIGAILVSGRVIDAENSPEAGRKSRIFVLVLGYLYIPIGMFFIAKRLERIAQANASASH